jgi:pimeloyl-ACP methyl ester carboxylesterase
MSRLALATAVLAVSTSLSLGAGVAAAEEDGATESSPASSETTSQTESEPEREPDPEPEAEPEPEPEEEPDPEDVTDEELPDLGEDDEPPVVEDDEPDLADEKPKRTSALVTREPAATAETDVTAEPDVADREPTVEAYAVPEVGEDPDPPAVPPMRSANLGKQLTGGVFDVGTIVVSVVHSVASAVAQAVGPDTLFGVPYMLAMTVVNSAAAVGRVLVGGPLYAPPSAPYSVSYGILDMIALFNPARSPAGANDPTISVTAEHPLPVILLNSTVLTQGVNWAVGAPVLANAGYKVYTFNYGNRTSNPNFPIQSIDDIRVSAQELSDMVDRVLAETGAPQVVLIGHSQGGGILPVYYINNLDGAEKVSQVIGIAPGNHGADFNGLVSGVLSIPILRELYIGLSALLGPAFYQQSMGSPFMDEVYGDGDTRGDVLYTNILTEYDEVATPYTNHVLHGPNVTNIVLQQRFPGLLHGHLNSVVSPYVWATVLEALEANPAANPLAHQQVVAA